LPLDLSPNREPNHPAEQPRRLSGLVPGSSPGQPTKHCESTMAWVYILHGDSGRYYFGSTTDLDRRIREHRRGHTHSTKRLGGNLTLVASLETATLREARELERQMKRKKNPQLALGLIAQPGAESSSRAAPNSEGFREQALSGLVPGSSPGQPTKLFLF
jgi:predicted GIY-YIG superfamily endonuclease